MSRQKFLIPALPLLTVSYHMVRLIAVMTNNSYEELCLRMNLLFFVVKIIV